MSVPLILLAFIVLGIFLNALVFHLLLFWIKRDASREFWKSIVTTLLDSILGGLAGTILAFVFSLFIPATVVTIMVLIVPLVITYALIKAFFSLSNKSNLLIVALYKIAFPIAIALVIIPFKTFVYENYRFTGPSMCPTFNLIDGRCEMGAGDFLFVNKLSFEPQRGDIVSFKTPKGSVYMKRIIGMPGDKVELTKNEVFVTPKGGEEFVLPEPYKMPRSVNNMRASLDIFDVPEGHYLILGDNRNQSLDARRCFQNVGCDENSSPYIPRSSIIGKVTHVYSEGQVKKKENPFNSPSGGTPQP